MSNFPDLLNSFDGAVEALKVKLSQDPSSSTTYNGEHIQSIAKDIADRWTPISAMMIGRRAVSSVSALPGTPYKDADGNDILLMEVYADADSGKNGLWGWDTTNSNWFLCDYDRFTRLGNPYRHGVLGLMTGENTSKDNFVFDFVNQEIRIARLFAQNRTGVWVEAATIAIDPTSRNLYWNSESGLYSAYPASVGNDEITKNDYLVAVFRPESGVSWCAFPHYKVLSNNSDVSFPRNGQRLAVLGSPSDSYYINFDFDNNQVVVEGDVYIYNKDSPLSSYPRLTGLSVSIDPDTRFIYYDNDTNSLVAASKTAYDPTIVTNDVWVVAVIWPIFKSVVWCGAKNYAVNGLLFNYEKSYLAPVAYELSVRSKRFRQGVLQRVNPSSNYIDFDFSNNQIVITAGVNVTFGDDAYDAISATQTIAVGASSRYLYYDRAAKAFYVTDGNNHTYDEMDGLDPYLIATFRVSTGAVYSVNTDYYRINGQGFGPYQMVPDRNLIDYVLGQEVVAEKWSIPVCDLYRQSGFNYDNKDSFIQSDQLHYTAAGYAHIANLTTDFIRRNAPAGNLSGKSIGVFGGSFSVIAESQAAKDVWVSELGVTYTDYGIGGAGFAKAGNYIDDQVDSAAVHDIYVIWCSTNDATAGSAVGELTDADHTTQAGGMNLTISKLIAKAPTAKILILNSLKAFSHPWLYDPTAIR
ncbi:TPA: hypothetical protein ACPJ1C_001040 [Vibrio diabolicus]